jgi:acyl-activating enzyme 14
VLLGGGELDVRLQQRLRLLVPNAHIMTAYGMTEACSSMTFCPLLPELPPLGSSQQPCAAEGKEATAESATAAAAAGICVGRPPPGIEMAVLCGSPPDAQGTEWAFQVTAEQGREGEILSRGPHVMLGYWGEPEATARALLPGGWLRTGDLGSFDSAGRLWLLGRLKDVVRSGSENVSAAAVERMLLRLPGVVAAAVVGVPHERLGEEVRQRSSPSAIAAIHSADAAVCASQSRDCTWPIGALLVSCISSLTSC